MRLVSRFLLQTACLDRSDLHWKLLVKSCLGSKLEARVGVKRSPAYDRLQRPVSSERSECGLVGCTVVDDF